MLLSAAALAGGVVDEDEGAVRLVLVLNLVHHVEEQRHVGGGDTGAARPNHVQTTARAFAAMKYDAPREDRVARVDLTTTHQLPVGRHHALLRDQTRVIPAALQVLPQGLFVQRARAQSRMDQQ